MSDDGRPGIRRVEFAMGMPIVVDVRDEAVDAATLDALFDWFRVVDATFSTYKEDSEISRLNRGELKLADAHPDVRRGYVQQALLEFAPDREGDIAYLCGNPNMVDSAFDALKLQGLPIPHIRREKYVSSK